MTRTIYASTLADLHKALSTATGGETILLAGGDYGTFSMTYQNGYPLKFPSEVTIASADPANPAVFSGLDVRDSANLTFDGLVFDYTYKAGDSLSKRPFQFQSSENITVRNSVFDGDLALGLSAADDGYASGFGLSFRGSTGITVENNEIFNFYRGVTFGWSDDITVTGNEIHSIRMDGMNFSQVQGVLIEDNHLHSFARSDNKADHADMIQFWTNGTTEPSTDITIRGNVLDVGDGDATQSIFMRNDLVDRGLAGEEMFYRNVLIENNVIYNGHTNGIIVGATDGLVIRDNSVLYAEGARAAELIQPSIVPRISVDGISTDVSITGNVASSIAGFSGQADWVMAGNAIVQPRDPNAPGYYGDVFIASSLTTTDGANGYVIRPGSTLDAADAGSSHIQASGSTGFDAAFHVSRIEGNAAARLFDAGYTTGDLGRLPVGTRFLWEFGDGAVAEGRQVAHAYADGGRYDVTLRVVLPDGRFDIETTKVAMTGPRIVDMDDNGVFHTFRLGEGTALAATAAATDDGLRLGATGISASVARTSLSEMFVNDHFRIDLTLAAAKPGAVGEIFRLHNSFTASVTTKGEFLFEMNVSGQGWVKLTSTGLNLADGQERDVRIDVLGDGITLSVDGKVLAEAPLLGPMVQSGTGNLVFGNPWGRTNFDGLLSEFRLTIDADSYAAAASGARIEVPALPEPVAPDGTAGAPAPDDGQQDDGAVSEAPVFHAPPAPAPVVVVPPTSLTGMFDSDWSGFVLDIAGIPASDTIRLAGDTKVTSGVHGLAVEMDGDGDFLALGTMPGLQASDRIGFSVEFARDPGSAGDVRLVWQHLNAGLTLSKDGIVVQAQTADGGFKSFRAEGLGLDAGSLHRATVLIDSAEDRLQVIVDDRVVMDVTDTDFALGSTRQWTLGTPWNRFLDGVVTDFRLGDQFDFVDDYVGQDPQIG